MKVNEINEKIKMLGLNASDRQKESDSRDEAQTLLLLIETDESLMSDEKQMLLCELKKAIRPLALYNGKCENNVCEINSLIRELCLAASFYLLEKEKRIRLYEGTEDTFVNLGKRAFENRFFSIVSRLFSKNDEISVEIKASGCCCTVLISAKIPEEELCKNLPENTLAVYEPDLFSLALKAEMAKAIPEMTNEEDFSLLLSDSLSPLQIWLCDI